MLNYNKEKYNIFIFVLVFASLQNVLHYDGVVDLFTNFGEEPTPDEEVRMWELHLKHLTSLLTQLDLPMAQYIIQSLKQFSSQYAHSITYIKGEIIKVYFNIHFLHLTGLMFSYMEPHKNLL